MKGDRVNHTPMLWWFAAVVAVVAVSVATFAVHRHLIDRAIEQAAPAMAKRDSIRIASGEEKLDKKRSAAHRDTLENLLKIIELELEKRPTDSMLIISAANTAYDLEKFDKAELFYQMFLDKIDNSSVVAKIDLAYVTFKNGNTEKAASMLRRIISKDPKNQMAMFNLAYIYEQSGKPELAKTWIKKCKDADPNSQLGRQANAILSSSSTGD
jgi:tetratricopeptide (TPR) repeat protein